MQTLLLAVGIAQYQSDKITDLSVCHQDAQAMVAAFKRLAGGSLQHRLLINEQATKEQIRAGIRWLAETARQGDLAIFYYSGHGASDRDDTGDEPDAAEEFLCPYDCGVAPGMAGFIRDDELHTWLSAVSQKTERFALILDACHSGTATMAPTTATPKEIPPAVARALLGAQPPPLGAVAQPSVRGQLLLAGCQDEERSYILEGGANSLLTSCLLQALEQPEITTFQELYAHVVPLVVEQSERKGLQQTPRLADGTDGQLTFRG